jgi:type IV pilus assembly protein PilA
MKVRRGTKGFTLIELLIVVAIIGILAAIAIPAYTGYTAKAKVAGIVHSMGAIKNAVAAYYTEAGSIVAAADETAIQSTFNIGIAPQYANFSVSAAGVVKASIIANKIAGVAGGSVITLTPDATYKSWTWGGDAVTNPYLPKG